MLNRQHTRAYIWSIFRARRISHICSSMHARMHFLLVVKRTKQLLRSELNCCVIDIQTLTSENHTRTYTHSHFIPDLWIIRIGGKYPITLQCVCTRFAAESLPRRFAGRTSKNWFNVLVRTLRTHKLSTVYSYVGTRVRMGR